MTGTVYTCFLKHPESCLVTKTNHSRVHSHLHWRRYQRIECNRHFGSRAYYKMFFNLYDWRCLMSDCVRKGRYERSSMNKAWLVGSLLKTIMRFYWCLNNFLKSPVSLNIVLLGKNCKDTTSQSSTLLLKYNILLVDN